MSPSPGVPVTSTNGTVEQADYAIWKSTFGSTADLRADGNGDGVVSAGDYTVWRDHLGQSAEVSIAAASIATSIASGAVTSQDATAQVATTWPIQLGTDTWSSDIAFAEFEATSEPIPPEPLPIQLAPRKSNEQFSAFDEAHREIANEEHRDLCLFDADCLSESGVMHQAL